MKYSSQSLKNLDFCTNMQSFLIKNKEVQCATWIKSFSNFLTTKHSNLKSDTNQGKEEKIYFQRLRLLSPYFIRDMIALVSLVLFSVTKFQISLSKKHFRYKEMCHQ